MWQVISTILILFAAAVNLAPVSGVLSVDRMQALYGIGFAEPNLLILMRHRALLFAVVGVLLVVSAFHPPLRMVALIAGFFSMLSFVALAWLSESCNEELRRVAWIDVVASLALAASGLIDYVARTSAPTS